MKQLTKGLLKAGRDFFLLQSVNTLNIYLAQNNEIKAEIHNNNIIIKKGYWSPLSREELFIIKSVVNIEVDINEDECCGTLYSYIVKL